MNYIFLHAKQYTKEKDYWFLILWRKNNTNNLIFAHLECLNALAEAEKETNL